MADALATLRELVHRDPALQARLFALRDPRDFMTAVRELARAAGLPLHDGTVFDAMRRARPTGRQSAAVRPFTGWVPLSLSASGRTELVEWGYMGAERFTEPFCHLTLHALKAIPFNRLFRRESGFDLLRDHALAAPGLPLHGIIFHMSRCGSTLVSQWLAALPDSVVLSEPEPVDTLLQWQGDATTLRGLLSALGQPRRPTDRRLFLKTDAWHMPHLDRFMEAFPGIPWIFLYRDPVEVLVSHRRMPGFHLVPGSLTPHGLHHPQELGNRPIGHGAWAMSVFMRQARDAVERHGNGMLVNYSELPAVLGKRLPEHFGIAPQAWDTATLREVMVRHAKQPQSAFRPDAEEKRAAADQELVNLAARWLDEPYQALEEIRLRQPISGR